MHFFFYLENIINTEFTLRIEDFNNHFVPIWLETGPCMAEYTTQDFQGEQEFSMDHSFPTFYSRAARNIIIIDDIGLILDYKREKNN